MDAGEVEKLRERVFKLADDLRMHDVQIGEHGVLIRVLTTQLEALRMTGASREQVEQLETRLGQQIASNLVTVTLKVQHVHDDLAPIQRGIYWAVTLIIGVVILALLALVVKK